MTPTDPKQSLEQVEPGSYVFRQGSGLDVKASTISAGILLTVFACSSPPDYLGTVVEFQQHKNSGDVDAVMELFADEPILHFGPLGTISGPTNVRNILEYDLALNTHLQLKNCKVAAGEVSCRVVETNDWLKTVGIESIEYDENRFAFSEDGRIKEVHASLAAASAQSLVAAMAEFHQWATSTEPEAYSELFSDEGTFVYSGENAEKVLLLLKASRGN